ncbi:MAG TPA: hypothetical protein VNI57_10880 [Candidatus Saccharimonadales bacterium]|nr:hypothetical protein [Candidatus Saccharimonadales bacterium]
MRRLGFLAIAAAALILALLGVAPGIGEIPAAAGKSAPDFPTQDPASWINSPPLTMKGLRGRVVLLDVWTFG